MSNFGGSGGGGDDSTMMMMGCACLCLCLLSSASSAAAWMTDMGGIQEMLSGGGGDAGYDPSMDAADPAAAGTATGPATAADPASTKKKSKKKKKKSKKKKSNPKPGPPGPPGPAGNPAPAPTNTNSWSYIQGQCKGDRAGGRVKMSLFGKPFYTCYKGQYDTGVQPGVFKNFVDNYQCVTTKRCADAIWNAAHNTNAGAMEKVWTPHGAVQVKTSNPAPGGWGMKF